MAREAVIRLDVEAGSARGEIDQLEQDLEDIGVAAVEAGDGFSRIEQDAAQSLADIRSEARRTAQSMQSVSRSSASTANQFTTEFFQASQDAAFGIENVANQLPQLQAEFGRLQSETGSTKQAFGALFSSLKGPAGLIGAFTLLLTFKDQIIGFFTDTGQAAKEAEEQVQSAMEDLLSTLADERDLDALTTAVDDILVRIDELRRQRQQLQGEDELVIGFRRLSGEFIPSEEAPVGGPPGTAIPVTASERIQQLQTELERVREKRETVADEVSRRNALQRAGIDLTQEESEALDKVSDDVNTIRADWQGILGAVNQFEDSIQFLSRSQGGASAFGPEQLTPSDMGPQDGPFGPSRLERQISNVQLVGQAAKTQFDRVGDIQEQNNQKIAQGINLAAQLGATMIQAAQGADAEWNRVLGQILSTLGSIIGIVNPQAGAAVAGAGTLIGSFQHGGRVNTPLQIVGERGPELAAMPQGTQVMSNRDTREALSMEPVVRKLDEVAARVESVEVRMSTSEADDSLSALEAEEERMGAREYNPTG